MLRWYGHIEKMEGMRVVKLNPWHTKIMGGTKVKKSVLSSDIDEESR